MDSPFSEVNNTLFPNWLIDKVLSYLTVKRLFVKKPFKPLFYEDSTLLM